MTTQTQMERQMFLASAKMLQGRGQPLLLAAALLCWGWHILGPPLDLRLHVRTYGRWSLRYYGHEP